MNTAVQIPINFDGTGYPDGFFHWLAENPKIWAAFSVKAHQMAQLRKHYSARAIIHVIRWETELKDSDVIFKINNNWTPGLARLFMYIYPRYKGFFQIRNQQGLNE